MTKTNNTNLALKLDLRRTVLKAGFAQVQEHVAALESAAELTVQSSREK